MEKKPVLFIAGTEDSKIPVSIINDQASHASNSKIVILENVGHMGFIEDFGSTVKAVRDFGLIVH